MQTGSLINHLYANGTGITAPKVGDGATVVGWTDRRPATVVETFQKGAHHYVVVQYDKWTRTDKNGMSDAQEYVYSPNPEGGKSTYRLDKKGKWRPVCINQHGKFVYFDGTVLLIGVRERYYDFSF